MELQRKEYLMTKKEIRNLWIERLRSGTIKQGIGRLAIEDTRCCLGVLCDIAVEQQVIQPPTVNENGTTFYGVHDQLLPRIVKDWAGLKDAAGKYFKELGVEYLTSHNDSGQSFIDIANIIESEPEGLFVKETSND
jgi:hypothetical protein